MDLFYNFVMSRYTVVVFTSCLTRSCINRVHSTNLFKIPISCKYFVNRVTFPLHRVEDWRFPLTDIGNQSLFMIYIKTSNSNTWNLWSTLDVEEKKKINVYTVNSWTHYRWYFYETFFMRLCKKQ